jgi:hypothetical protein
LGDANLFFILAALLYLACAFMPSQRRMPISLGIVAGWVLHGGALLSDMFAPDARAGGVCGHAVVHAVDLGGRLLAGKSQFLARQHARAGAARGGIVGGAASVFPGNMVALAGKSDWFLAHIAISILAYSTLTIAAFHAVLMVLQESRLHTRPARRPGQAGSAWRWIGCRRC